MSDSNINTSNKKTAILILASGEVFFGNGAGKIGKTIGEICFNTATTGYQEILSDPSYSGQIINFTFPHIGNTGINKEDYESNAPKSNGAIFRNKITSSSNFRSEDNFDNWLTNNNITAITDVDTRAITKIIRNKGACNAIIVYDLMGQFDLNNLKKELADAPSMKGLELAAKASTNKQYNWEIAAWELGKGYRKNKDKTYKVVAIDFGAKLNILRCLSEENCEVIVLPAKSKIEEILSHNPDGVFLSNGPGDPAMTATYTTPVINAIIEQEIPLFGICLGHQLLALALGATTSKMKQGHRGANHPVKDLSTGKIEITSQNHGFMVDKETLPKDIDITHISLFDGSIEGISNKNGLAFSVQYHPESSPGPHDSHYLFKRFIELIKRKKD